MSSQAARRRYNQSEHGRKVNLAQSYRWRAAHREKVLLSYRKHDLKRYYNLTLEAWDAMFAAQGHACACCGSKTSGRKNGQWCTDHNHDTGLVRGILCNGCNMAAGQMKDDPKRCRLLAKYLEKGGMHARD
jgi:Recombination endonuclease VII